MGDACYWRKIGSWPPPLIGRSVLAARLIETARPCRKRQIEACFFRMAAAMRGMSTKFKRSSASDAVCV